MNSNFLLKISIYLLLSIFIIFLYNIFKYYNDTSRNIIITGFNDENVEKVYIGMPKNAAIKLFGNPNGIRIETKKMISMKYETWKYIEPFCINYLYFKNGLLSDYDITIYEKR
jgi:hypothetical protein